MIPYEAMSTVRKFVQGAYAFSKGLCEIDAVMDKAQAMSGMVKAHDLPAEAYMLLADITAYSMETERLSPGSLAALKGIEGPKIAERAAKSLRELDHLDRGAVAVR